MDEIAKFPSKVIINKKVKPIPVKDRIPPKLIIGNKYYTSSYKWVYRCTLIEIYDLRGKVLVEIEAPRSFPCPRLGKKAKIIITHVTIFVENWEQLPFKQCDTDNTIILPIVLVVGYLYNKIYLSLIKIINIRNA